MLYSNIRPLYDKVIVERIEERVTSSGIFIPDNASDKSQRGIVLAVGPGKCYKGVYQKPFVKIGDEVFFAKYSGNEIKIDGKDILIIKEEDIIGIFEKK